MIDIRSLLNGGLDSLGKTSSERWNLLIRAVIELQNRRFGGSGTSSSYGSGSGDGDGDDKVDKAYEADHAKEADYAKEAGHAKTADDISDSASFGKRFLRRDAEDYAEKEIGFLEGLWIKAKGLFGIDKDGNAKFSSTSVMNTLKVHGETILKQTTIGDYEKDIYVGIGSRQGIRMNPDGSIIARSLELSESL